MDGIVKMMGEVRERVSARTYDKIRQILFLVQTYSYLGKDFTFDVDEDMDAAVNKLLLELSDSVINDANEYARRAIVRAGNEEDTDAVLLYIARSNGGQTLTERTDMQASRLKYLIEGFFAVCFVNGMTNSDIIADLPVFLSNPNSYPHIREAKPGFASPGVSGGFHFGRGVDSDPIEGMTLTEQQAINEAFQHATLLKFRKDDEVIGYRVVRGSTYDCPLCDELCVGIHPLYEEVLPAHPRCCCRMVPVTRKDVI